MWLAGPQAWLAGPEGGGTDGQTDRGTENLPILQDFVPYWVAALLPHKGTADHLMPLGNLLMMFTDVSNKVVNHQAHLVPICVYLRPHALEPLNLVVGKISSFDLQLHNNSNSPLVFRLVNEKVKRRRLMTKELERKRKWKEEREEYAKKRAEAEVVEEEDEEGEKEKERSEVAEEPAKDEETSRLVGLESVYFLFDASICP